MLFSASEIESTGWCHYSKVDFVRGCVGESARDCLELWVDTAKTSNVSITCQWTLADGVNTSFLAEQGSKVHLPKVYAHFLGAITEKGIN